MNEIKMLFGQRIKELRNNLSLSQEELSEKAQISSRYLSRVEMGQQFPSLDTLVRLGSALNAEMKDFFEFAHKSTNKKQLEQTLNSLIKEADEEKLRLLVKVVRAVVK